MASEYNSKMSLRNKRSSSSLAPSIRQNSILSHNEYNSHNPDKQQSIDQKIEKKFKRMSTLFHKAKTEDGSLTNNGNNSTNSIGKNSSNSPEIPLPQSSTNNSFYSLMNNSSGTLVSRQHDVDMHHSGSNKHGFNNVEFTNIRSALQPEFYGESETLPSPSSASFADKTKDSKLGRFLTKTGNKVKKFSDISGEQLNHGLGLGSHGYSHSHGFPELSIQNSFLTVGNGSKDLKSPIVRGFGKPDQKISFGDKLKLPTKYKNYHYHSLLRNKKESFKKLGSKNNDMTHGYNMNTIMAGTSYALYDINYLEIERLINNDLLNFEQCDQYCKYLYDRLYNSIIPMFKGDSLPSSIEDTTKLVSLYVRLRKAQEGLLKDKSLDASLGSVTAKSGHDNSDSHFNNNSVNTDTSASMGTTITVTNTPNNNSVNTSNNTSNNAAGNANKFNMTHSQSQNSLNSDINEFETPFMKPNATFVNSPMAAELNSPTAFSPMIKMNSTSFIAISKVLEELNDIIKHGVSIMVNQLYYDEATDTVKFIRGNNPILRKRKNTTQLMNEDGIDDVLGKSSNSLYAMDMGVNTSTRSVMDLPVLTPTHTTASFDVRGENWDSFGDSYDDMNNDFHNENDGTEFGNIGGGFNTHNDMINFSALPVGKFETCTSVLWDIFQRNILFDLCSILLPIELEFAGGHKEISRIHNRANSILYNKGEKMVSFTNTLVYPEISPYTNTSTGGNKFGGSGSIVGSLGEWSDLNIRNILLMGFRDYVVIPLYEMNRQFEDVEGVGIELERIRSDKKLADADDLNDKYHRQCRKSRDNIVTTSAKTGSRNLIQEYTDAYMLLQCFRLVSSVGTNDTNQKLVENLLVQMRDKCRQYESV